MLARILGAAFKPAIGVPLVAALVAGAELVVANRKYGVFTGGFGQSSAVDTGGELAIFLAGFALAHIALALLAWKLAARLARSSGAQSAVLHFAFLYGGISLLGLSLRYQHGGLPHACCADGSADSRRWRLPGRAGGQSPSCGLPSPAR